MSENTIFGIEKKELGYGLRGFALALLLVAIVAGIAIYAKQSIATTETRDTQQVEQQAGSSGLGGLFGASASTIAVATKTGIESVPITVKDKNGRETSLLNTVEIKNLQYISDELTGQIRSRTSEMIGIEIDIYSGDGKPLAGRYASAPPKESIDYRPFKIPIPKNGGLTKTRIEISLT